MPATPFPKKGPASARQPREEEPIERDVADEETDRQGPESERALHEPVTRFPAG